MADESKCFTTIRNISDLKARYFYLLDTKNWHAFAELFTSDAYVDGREGFAARNLATNAWTVNGPAELVEKHLAHLDLEGMRVTGGQAIASKAALLFPPHIITVHHGHMGEIVVDEEDGAAHAVWAMEDRILYPDGYALRELHGFGHYHETYVRLEQGWKISGFRLTRLRVDIR